MKENLLQECKKDWGQRLGGLGGGEKLLTATALHGWVQS